MMPFYQKWLEHVDCCAQCRHERERDGLESRVGDPPSLNEDRLCEEGRKIHDDFVREEVLA